MIQDIAPHTYDPVFRRKKPEDRDYLLHYEYNKVMLIKSGRGSVIPTFGELGDAEQTVLRRLWSEDRTQPEGARPGLSFLRTDGVP